MKKILLATLLIAILAMGVSAVSRTSAQTRGGITISVPEHAVEVAPGIFSLGSAVKDGKKVEGLMFVHYKENHARPDGKGKPSKGGGGSSTCYALLGKGAKWKSPEDWLMNPSNNQGLDEAALVSREAADIQKWEDEAGTNILGNGVQTSLLLAADTNAPDGFNEVYFGEIADPGVIAVTITWGVFSGPPQSRELVEMDQVFDEQDFSWSLNGAASSMDFDNIATHELGHGVGMGHPDSTCTEETMYAYADNGETKKRDLNAGDIAGIKSLY